MILMGPYLSPNRPANIGHKDADTKEYESKTKLPCSGACTELTSPEIGINALITRKFTDYLDDNKQDAKVFP